MRLGYLFVAVCTVAATCRDANAKCTRLQQEFDTALDSSNITDRAGLDCTFTTVKCVATSEDGRKWARVCCGNSSSGHCDWTTVKTASEPALTYFLTWFGPTLLSVSTPLQFAGLVMLYC